MRLWGVEIFLERFRVWRQCWSLLRAIAPTLVAGVVGGCFPFYKLCLRLELGYFHLGYPLHGSSSIASPGVMHYPPNTTRFVAVQSLNPAVLADPHRVRLVYTITVVLHGPLFARQGYS